MRPALAALLAALTLSAPAGAYPATCFDQRLCGDLNKVYYCPDTGTIVSAFAPCKSLVVGPYTPGGLVPNTGISQ